MKPIHVAPQYERLCTWGSLSEALGRMARIVMMAMVAAFIATAGIEVFHALAKRIEIHAAPKADNR